jgi:predicted DNA-binding protein
MEKQKRRRAPGGGRKPGEFGKLGAVMGLRLPDKLKEELEQAAEESGRSLSGEMIWQLSTALARERGREKKLYQMVHNVDSSLKDLERWLLAVKQKLGLKPKWKK